MFVYQVLLFQCELVRGEALGFSGSLHWIARLVPVVRLTDATADWGRTKKRSTSGRRHLSTLGQGARKFKSSSEPQAQTEHDPSHLRARRVRRDERNLDVFAAATDQIAENQGDVSGTVGKKNKKKAINWLGDEMRYPGDRCIREV
jgi:hypothetical protein